VQGEYGVVFANPGTGFIEDGRGRGTILIGAASLSPVTNFGAGNGAVSRYNVERSQ